MMRLIQQLGEQVVTRGAARRTGYAARRPVRGSSAPIPLYRIGLDGRGEQIATLDPIYPLGCALRYTAPLEWPLAREMRDGWPAYDMLPMRYAPVRGVELPPRDYEPPLPLPDERADWRLAAAAAIAFWHSAGADRRIGAPFRAVCRANGAALKRWAELA